MDEQIRWNSSGHANNSAASFCSAMLSRGAVQCVALLHLVAVLGCHPPSESDRAALEELRTRFGESYEFKVRHQLYVNAVARKSNTETTSDDEARRIWETFWLTDDGVRRQTTFVYLNLFDRRGKFVCQYHWGSVAEGLSRSDQPYY